MLKQVKTKYGIYESVESNAGYALFKGIAYAKPPIGDLRWKPPVDPDIFEGIKVCDSFKPACPQYDRWALATDDVTDDSGHPYIKIKNYPYPPKMSEDCLYLNIYTPAISNTDKLPVMFYIHGGGCQQWYGSDYEYCGDGFCKHGCIVVTITYRLNVFGYFTHPDLLLESENNTCGNYGLMDQIQALKWVYENIEGFGGDKDNITCFGQSSGGRSSLAALCSPLSKNYIKRVSLQSCSGLGQFMNELSKDEMLNKGVEFGKYLNCDSVEELRKLDWKTLRDANDKLYGMWNGFNMYVDGYVLEHSTDYCLINNTIKPTDIIIGCTIDEGANEKKSPFGGNMCSSIIALLKANTIHNIYSYVFARKQVGDDVGVPHSCDNRYQFKTLDGSWRPYTNDDYKLSDIMQEYWSNFARTGNPNSQGLVKWDPCTKENLAQLKLDVECEMHDFTKDNLGIDELSESILLESKGGINV